MKSSQSILFGILFMLVCCRGYYASVRDRKDLCPKINPWVFLGYRPLSKYYFIKKDKVLDEVR